MWDCVAGTALDYKERLRTFLDLHYPCGVVRRDGACVGAWITYQVRNGPDGHDDRRSPDIPLQLDILAMLRTADGRVVGERVALAPGPDVEAKVLSRLLDVPPHADATWHASRADEFVKNLGCLRNGGVPGPLDFDDRLTAVAHANGLVMSVLGVGPDGGGRLRLVGEATLRNEGALSAFLATLDPRALVLRRDALPRCDGVAACWPALDRTFDPDAPLAAACLARPLFAHVLVEAWNHDPAAFAAASSRGRLDALLASRIVRRGLVPSRLLPALLAAEHAFSVGVPDGLTRNRYQDVFRLGAPIAAVSRMSGLPGAWLPKGDDEWIAFANLVPEIDLASGMGLNDDVARFLNAGGRWGAYLDRLATAAGVEGHDGIHRAVEDVLDMAKAYALQVLAPVVAAVTEDEPRIDGIRMAEWGIAGFAILFSGRSLPRILELSTDWHARQGRMRALVAGIAGRAGGDPSRWPAGFPNAVLGDVAVEVLTDEASLVAEGSAEADDGVEGLSHCVGGYADACRRDGMRILSLRRLDENGRWTRLSTAQVEAKGFFDQATNEWVAGEPRVVQHRGRGNAAPPQEAELALTTYIADIVEGIRIIDMEGLEPMPTENSLAVASGFDWREGGTLVAVRALWDRYVSGTVRGIDDVTLCRLAMGLSGDGHLRWLPRTVGPDTVAAWEVDGDADSAIASP